MSSLDEPKDPSEDKERYFLRVFLQKLRKRRIIETLVAFIGGSWLGYEIVERVLVIHIAKSHKRRTTS